MARRRVAVLRELFDHLKRCQTSPEVKAIVITGANGVFSGGFDISKFQDGGADEDLSSNVNKAFLDLVETGPKPTVAALSKIALGGGCELAVSCNARVATPGMQPRHDKNGCANEWELDGGQSVRAGTKIGLPELQLGIIPGFGGTQRLPRLVGLQQAIMMMLTSQPITADKGMKAGLIDAVVPPADLLPRARALALDMANLRTARKITIDHTAKLESLAEAEAILKFARAEATKRAGVPAFNSALLSPGPTHSWPSCFLTPACSLPMVYIVHQALTRQTLPCILRVFPCTITCGLPKQPCTPTAETIFHET